MLTFVVEELPNPGARYPTYKLWVGDECPFDTFYRALETEGSYVAELDKLQTYILYHGLDQRLPPDMLKELERDGNDDIKDYEFRSRHLRVYLFRHPQSGKIIVCAGNKKTQKADIAYLRRLKHAFCADHSALHPPPVRPKQ